MSTPRLNRPGLASLWNRFFFSEEAPFGLAMIRILLPWVMIVDGLYRWPHARELYSADGATAPIANNFGYYGMLPEFSAPVVVALHTAMLFLLVTTSLGWCTRLSIIGSGLLYFYFGYMDCISTITKYTVIAMHVMLLLSVSNCGGIWSVDAWLNRSAHRLPGPVAPPRFAVWSQRLIQILIAMVYFGAAITKLHTPSFFSGDQMMYWMITYINNEHPLGDWLSQFPLALVLFSYVAVIWEIVFPFTVWNRWGRWPTLALGALFHVMTALTLGLFIFPFVMITSYAAFLREEDFIALHRFARNRLGWTKLSVALQAGVHRLPAWQPPVRWATATFALVLTLTMWGGVQAEQMLDVYQMRGPNGPLPLEEISQAEAARLLGPDKPLREADKVLAVDVGTLSVGEHLVDRRSEFRIGQTAIVQVTFTPPHEDLWVECLLRDVDNRIISRMGQIVARENFRAHFHHMLDKSLEPGQYVFQIKSANQEVLRKEIHLLPADQ